ncbi:MAG: hypothetical protein WC479_07230 [Candidatus Izemoplasmatales bacterium]
MFTKKELEAIRDVGRVKFNDILQSNKGSDADYIRDLQTLISLRNAAEEKLNEDDCI